MKRITKFSLFKWETIEEVGAHQQEIKMKTVFIGTYGIEGHYMSVNFPGNGTEEAIFWALSIPDKAQIQIYTYWNNEDTVYCDPGRVLNASSPEDAFNTVLKNYNLLLH